MIYVDKIAVLKGLRDGIRAEIEDYGIAQTEAGAFSLIFAFFLPCLQTDRTAAEWGGNALCGTRAVKLTDQHSFPPFLFENSAGPEFTDGIAACEAFVVRISLSAFFYIILQSPIFVEGFLSGNYVKFLQFPVYTI